MLPFTIFLVWNLHFLVFLLIHTIFRFSDRLRGASCSSDRDVVARRFLDFFVFCFVNQIMLLLMGKFPIEKKWNLGILDSQLINDIKDIQVVLDL